MPDAGAWTGAGSGSLVGRNGSKHAPRVVLTTKSGEAVGETELFVCATCGWFEEYLKNPESLPWDQVDGVWSQVTPPVPYR